MLFEGFTRETIAVLSEIGAKRSSAWFNENRARCEQFLLLPLRALAAELSEVMLLIDREFAVQPYQVLPDFSRSAHFCKPIRLTFRRPSQHWRDAPAYFFELAHDSYRYGMGFDKISRESLANMRQAVETKPDYVRELLRGLKGIPALRLEGEEYTRMPALSIPGDLMPLYLKKNVSLVARRPIDGTAPGRELAEELASSFARLGSMYYFLQHIRRQASPAPAAA